MLRKQPPVFIATCTVSIFLGAPASAADLTIASALSTAGRMPVVPVKSADTKKSRAPAADNVKHANTHLHTQRRILAYKLPDDTFVKLNTALGDQSRPVIARVDTPGRAASAIAMPANGAPSDGAGVGFNCRDKFTSNIPSRRGVVACYRSKLDNAWRAQTYVSGRMSDGSPNWAGGLLLSYAY